MEKFLLGTLLSYNKLDIIDQENVVVAVFFPKLCGGNIIFVSDRVDQLIGKGLGTDVKNLGFRVVFQYKMSDCMHQMGFSKSYASVDKQRIVDFARRFRYRKGCRVGQIVVGADYKGIKGILWV